MSRRCLIAILAIVSLPLCVVPTWAGDNIWTPTGPDGGPIRAVLVDPSTPSTIYIGTGGSGVFKSVDSGVTWVQSDPLGPLASLTVRSLIFGATGTIYASSDKDVAASSGVFQSDNGGTSWTSIGTAANGLTNRKVQALAWDGTTLYAGTREENPVVGGVFKWNGATWTLINTGLTGLPQSARRVQALAIDPRTTPPVVYAGTQGEGVFKSIDAGANWLRVDNPANQSFKSDCLEKPEILALVVDTTINPLLPVAGQGVTGAVLYAGATGSTGDLTTQACSETPANGGGQGQGAGFFRLVPEGFNGGCLAGLIPPNLGCWDRQMNGAFEILLPTTVSSEVWSIVMKTDAAPTRIYIGTDIGLFTSNDSATSWDAVPRQDLPDGLIGLPIRALGVDPAAACAGGGTVRLNAGTGGRGMFARCPNPNVGGPPFTLTNGGLTALRAQAVAVASLDDASSKVYAGLVGGGIITSINGGASWQNTGETELTVRAIAPDPGAANVVYAATAMGVIKTTNGGTTWTLASAGLPQVCNDPLTQVTCLRAQSPNNPNPPRTVRAILVDPAKSGVVYAAVGGLYRSLNGGTSWAALNGNPPNNLPDEVKCGVSCPGNGTVSAIVVDHSSGDPVYGTLYLATDGSALPVPAHGVYRSIDGGATWTTVNGGILLADQYITSLGLDPLPQTGLPIVLYAGASTGKVYRTQNGTSWVSPAGTNPLPGGNAVTALAVEMADPRVIYAALSGGGVYFSGNNGFDWTALNTGLSSLDVLGLAIDGTKSPHALHAATLGRGMHHFEIVLTSPPFLFLDQAPPYPLQATSSPFPVSGTFLDDTGVNKIFWSTNRGHAGTATLTGGAGWNAPVILEPGLNVITVTAIDTNVPSNEGSDSLTVNLTLSGAVIQVTPSSLVFGTVAVGGVSTLQNVTVKNNGTTGNLNVGTITLGGVNPGEFNNSPSKDFCSSGSLAPGASCLVGVRFKPTSGGAKSATLVIPSNDATQPTVTVTLSGTGTGGGAPAITVTPSSLGFGTLAVGGVSALQNVTVRNVGATGNLTVTSITLGGVNPGEFNNSPAKDFCTGVALAPGASCLAGVRFKPTSGGAKSATLVIASNDAAQPTVTVTLSGTGTGGGPAITVTPSSLMFGTLAVGGVSVLQNVTVRNVGATGNLTVTSITLGGVNPGEFNNPPAKDFCTGVALAPGASCLAGVRFKPTSGGAKSATLAIASNDVAQPTVTVNLSGTGQ